MKKEYLKPDMKVVELQHHAMLLAGSNNKLRGVSATGLVSEDNLYIDDDEAGDGFWGR